MDKIQGATATPDRKFTLGVPEVGTHGTIVTAEWLNHVQDEICNVILSENMSLDDSASNQLSAAIKQKLNALKEGCEQDIVGFKTEVEQWKKQIQSTILTLAKESELKRLQAITDTDKTNLLQCFEILNNFNNEFVEKLLKILKNLDQNYLLQDSRFTQVFNTYGAYLLKQVQGHKQEIEQSKQKMLTQLKNFNSLYALIGHNHDSSYSLKSHNHNELYSSINHNHDSSYSLRSHNHNELYSSINHNHDSSYSLRSHNHNELYSLTNHTHPKYEITPAYYNNFSIKFQNNSNTLLVYKYQNNTENSKNITKITNLLGVSTFYLKHSGLYQIHFQLLQALEQKDLGALKVAFGKLFDGVFYWQAYRTYPNINGFYNLFFETNYFCLGNETVGFQIFAANSFKEWNVASKISFIKLADL